MVNKENKSEETAFWEFDSKEWIKTFKENKALKIVKPKPYLIVLAHAYNHFPCVWAKKMFIHDKWIVVDSNADGRCYMSKQNGVFCYTDNIEDRLLNAFDTLEDAVEAFKSFYK